MATKTTGDLELWKPEMTDSVADTMGTHLPQNFDKIDEAITELNEEIENLGSDKVDQADIVDNLTEGGTDKVLSAEQGKVLSTQINELTYDDWIVLQNIKEKSKVNLYNKDTVTAGKYVNNSGVLTDSATLSVSDYIPVTEGTVMTVSKGASSTGGVYDADKTWIAKIPNPAGVTIPYSFTVPTGGKYIRVNVNQKEIDTFMVVEGDTIPSSYVRYGAKIDWLKIDNDNIEPEATTIDIYNIKDTEIRNLFNKKTITVNKYVNNSGVLTDSATLSVSDYIPVRGNTEYSVTVGYSSQGGYYDINKNWIGKIKSSESSSPITFTTPYNCAYVRLNMFTRMAKQWMMVPGNSYPASYKSYGASIPLLDNKRLTGTVLYTFGDSITWYDGKAYRETTKEAGVIVRGYQSYIKERLDITIVNKGYSGYTTPEINAKVKTVDMTDADMITIMSGTNDFRDMTTEELGTIQAIGSTFDTSTFIGAYQDMIEYILTTYPNVTLMLFTPIKGWTDSNGLMPETYPNAILELAKLYSLPCLDLYHQSGINDLTKGIYIVDNDDCSYAFHPSTLGYKRMADLIVPFISNHYINP